MQPARTLADCLQHPEKNKKNIIYKNLKIIYMYLYICSYIYAYTYNFANMKATFESWDFAHHEALQL